VGFDEENVAMGDAIHAGFEGGDEREVDFAESEGVEAHVLVLRKMSKQKLASCGAEAQRLRSCFCRS
jgi:hypothetical protein